MNTEQFKVPERQYNDTLSVQAGVEDTSAATKMSGYAQGVSGLASTANTAGSIYNAEQTATKKAEKETADNQLLFEYQQGIEEAIKMRQQGVSTAKLREYYRTLDRDIVGRGGSIQDMLAVRSKMEGFDIAEKTPSELASEAWNKAATDNGVPIDHPDREELGRMIVEVSANPNIEAAAFSEVMLPVFSAGIDGIVASNMPYREKEAVVQEMIGRAQTDALRGVKDTAMRSKIVDTYTNLAKAKLATVDPNLAAKDKADLSKNKIDVLFNTAFLTRMAQMSDSSLQVFMLDRFAPSISTAIVEQFGIKASPNLLGDMEGLAHQLKQIKELTDSGQLPRSLDKAQAKSVEYIAQQCAIDVAENKPLNPEVESGVNAVLDSAETNLSIQSPKDAAPVVKALAGGVGDFIQNVPEKIAPEQKERIKQQLGDHFMINVLPDLQERVKMKSGGMSGRSGSRNVAASRSLEEAGQDVKVTVAGDGTFSLATDSTDMIGAVKRFNQTVSKDLNQYFKALSKVTGSDMNTIVQEFGPLILPNAQGLEKAPESTEAPDGIPVADEDINLTERPLGDTGMVYKEGSPQGRSGRTGTVSPEPIEAGTFDPSIGTSLLGGAQDTRGGETPIPTDFENMAPEEISEVLRQPVGLTDEEIHDALSAEAEAVGVGAAEVRSFASEFSDLNSSRSAVLSDLDKAVKRYETKVSKLNKKIEKYEKKALNENVPRPSRKYAEYLAEEARAELTDLYISERNREEGLRAELQAVDAKWERLAKVKEEFFNEGATEAQKALGSSLLEGAEDTRGGETPIPTEETQDLGKEAPVTIGDRLFDSIAGAEGSGTDVTGDVPTAHYGVTETAAKAVGHTFSENQSKEQSKKTAIAYTNYLEDKVIKKAGKNWDRLPDPVKGAVLHELYNLGEEPLGYSGFGGALAGKFEGVKANPMYHLLDTATADGKTMKGLAKRRAEQYNKSVGANERIAKVEAKEDGTIEYLLADGTVLTKFKTKGGRHSDSSPGVVTI